MKIVIVEANQSLRDIAVAQYGTLESLGELVANNAGKLRNDRVALAAAGIDYMSDTSFYIDIALEAGSAVQIDDQSRTIKSNITRDMQTPQTKYENGQEY